MESRAELLEHDKISRLERMLSAATQQFKGESKRCDDLQRQISILVQDKLTLEKKLTELECQYAETKKELDNFAEDNRSLSEKNYNLEIALAEGDVYEQVLKENMDKLENLCTTLREQRDEQTTYHKQKEISLKSDFERKLYQLKSEKAEANKNLTELKLQTVSMKDELKQYREAQCDWAKEKERLIEDVENLSRRLQILEKDLNLEKETVSTLSLKNNDLSASLMEVDKSRQMPAPISKSTVSMIEELVNKFYEKKIQASNSFNDQLIEKLKKQLAESETSLADEKQARFRLESRLETTAVELLRAKTEAESLFELSIARTQNNLNRCNNLKSSPRQTHELYLSRLNPLVSPKSPDFENPVDDVPLDLNRAGSKPSNELSDNDENTAADSIFTNVSDNLLQD